MDNDTKDKYFLGRSETEARRLDEQGLLFESALDYQVHPDIASGLPSNPKIADVGTGTGDYLVRLSKSYPDNAGFVGFDISPIQFCSESKRPKNVKLVVHDLKTPFPSEYHGFFDFVHLRLLVAAMDEDDWVLAARNLFQILRPGGGIQWEEGDYTHSRRIRGGSAGTSAKKLDLFCDAFMKACYFRFQFGCSNLPTTLGEVGFERVDQDIVASDRVLEDRKRMGKIAIQAMVNWAKKKNMDSIVGHKLEDIARFAEEEVDAGAYSRFEIYSTFGFRSPVPLYLSPSR